MKVQQILESKGGDVFAVDLDDSVRDAVALLNAKNIGAVVVRSGSNAVAGILSERDVVRRLGAAGAGALDLPVRDVMTPDPTTCEPQSDLEEIMATMTERRIRHLPVCEQGALCGLVSIGDVVKRKIELAEQEARQLKDYISA